MKWCYEVGRFFRCDINSNVECRTSNVVPNLTHVANDDLRYGRGQLENGTSLSKSHPGRLNPRDVH